MLRVLMKITQGKQLLSIKRKIAQNFLVQGPGYAKRPLGYRVAYPA